MDEQKQSLIDRIKQAQNILVTVSANPSVDQLSAAIGLTLALNKLDKHGTAVFSGQVPNTIEFLKPEETLEKNTDSLRDFIIALDKSKADKLRYKVEDEVVRIFITPYRTSISDKDLQFSQGDFNVDVVVALGVSEQKDLDAAITAHGRILHDATVASVSNTAQSELGTLNWADSTASSLCEMAVTLIDGLDKKVIDNQIATALLTGIVANTERFSNDKTTPKTMSASAELMAAGANQQLIANELENPTVAPPAASEATGDEPEGDGPAEAEDPGTLEISHQGDDSDTKDTEGDKESDQKPSEPEKPQPQVHVDENGQLVVDGADELPQISQVRGVGTDGKPTEAGNEPKRERMTEPPKFGDGDLTANAEPEELDPPTEDLTLPKADQPLLTHNERNLEDAAKTPPSVMLPPLPLSSDSASTPPPPAIPSPMPDASIVPPSPLSMPVSDDVSTTEVDKTLADIENSVHSPHLMETDTKAAEDVDSARSAVEAALNNVPAAAPMTDPIAALNAHPLGDTLHDTTPPAPAVVNAGFNEPTPGSTPADDTLDMPLPSNPFGPGVSVSPTTPPSPAPASASAFPGTPPPPGGQIPPPPVPPPMLPPLQ